MARVIFKKIPSTLSKHLQWVLWKFVSKGGKKPTKVPLQPNGAFAKCNTPSTWSDFNTCQKAFYLGKFDGIGFCFAKGDGLTGIDLDNCFGSDGQLKPWAKELVDLFQGTYIERSPSGQGLHIWCNGKPVKTGSKKWKTEGTDSEQGIEIYDYSSPRYFTVTGDVVSGRHIINCQPALDQLYQQYFFETIKTQKHRKNTFTQVDFNLLLMALTYISADEYNTWIKIGMALKSGGIDFEVWDGWSRTSLKYVPGECDRKWATFDGK